MATPPLQNRVAIRTLLLEGWHAAHIAKYLGISHQAVAKHIRFYVGKGEFKAVSGRPTHYVRIAEETYGNPPLRGSPQWQPKPTALPHHFGAIFAMVQNKASRAAIHARFGYNRFGHAYEKRPTHTTEFGLHKAQIYIKSFYGVEPKEILANAKQAAMEHAQRYESEFGIKLTFLRLHRGVEWAETEKERSDAICAQIGLAKNEEILVAGVRHKNGDASHDTLEFIPTKANQEGATAHAEAHHFVYSGGLAKTLEAMGEAIVAIKTGQDVLVEAMKKKGAL